MCMLTLSIAMLLVWLLVYAEGFGAPPIRAGPFSSYQHAGSRNWQNSKKLPICGSALEMTQEADEQPHPGNRLFSSISARLIPPIDEANHKLSLKEQFHPKFISEEFNYGFMYMTKRLPLLLGVATICHFFRTILPVTKATIRMVPDLGTATILQLMEENLKNSVLDALPVLSAAQKNVVKQRVLGPAIEELFYRGIGLALRLWTFRVNCWVFATVCRWNIFAALAIPVLHLVQLLNAMRVHLIIPTFVRPSKPVILCAPFFREILHAIVFYPVAWQIAKTKFGLNRNTDESSCRPAEKPREKNGDRKESQSFSRRISSILTSGKDTDQSSSLHIPSLEASIDRALPLSARLFSAYAFGHAHGFGCGFVDVSVGLRVLQKCFGTFASSLLVESRLVLKRRNLWCAVGAHFAFNLLVDSFVTHVGLWKLFAAI